MSDGEKQKEIKRLKVRLLQLKVKLLKLLLGKKKTAPTTKGPKHIVIHHGAGDLGFAGVNLYHKRKWGFKSSLGFYAGYHYFIEKNGQLFQARRDTERAAHTVEPGRPGYWNNNSIGVCLQGNFEKEKPTAQQLSTLKELLDKKCEQHDISRTEVRRHEEIASTLCPGKNLKNWIISYKKS